MLSYANDSWLFCLQLNGAKKPMKNPDTGKVEQINEEMQLDRIIARSEERVMTPKGYVKGKQCIVQDIKYHNPYVLVLLKVVSEEIADLIKQKEEIEWDQSIEDYRKFIKENNVTDLGKNVNKVIKEGGEKE